jgi:hypothetical protein
VAAQTVNDVWPPPRSYHTATLVVSSETQWKMFVIGGKGKIDLEEPVYELKISVTGEESRPPTGSGEAVVFRMCVCVCTCVCDCVCLFVY